MFQFISTMNPGCFLASCMLGVGGIVAIVGVIRGTF